MPKLAILFWFYKKPLICKNRLAILKKYNPDLKIYGLFGGNPNEAAKYKNVLGKYLDDLYVFPSDDSGWKWINGDLMILDWYKKRGENLSWESLAVVQWDMLVLTDLKNIFRKIKRGQMYLSGLRTLTGNLEKRWSWTRPNGKYRKDYLAFLKYVQSTYGLKNRLSCCLFIFQIFPKSFLEKFRTTRNSRLGFLEYKIPTYAKIFKIPMFKFKKDLGCQWFNKKLPKGYFPLNADSIEISKTYIRSEMKKKNGFRMFHPFEKIWNDSRKG